jgi:hypothetical protein
MKLLKFKYIVRWSLLDRNNEWTISVFQALLIAQSLSGLRE